MATGPWPGLATTPPVLPPRPANPIPRAPDARSILILAEPEQPSKSIWAAVAKTDCDRKQSLLSKLCHDLRPKPNIKKPPKAKLNKRLFLRIEKDCPWRKLSTSCLRCNLESTFHYLDDEITSLYRVRTGFAMLAKNKTIR